MTNKIRVIDIEHHFETERLIDFYFSTSIGKALNYSDEQLKLMRRECDLDALLLEDMDKAGIDYSHVSFTAPAGENCDPEFGKLLAAEANDRIAEAIKKHPDRIGGFMALVAEDVEWSLKEIDRCAAMGLWGWCTMSNYRGESRIDDPKYMPILRKLDALGMPIFIHSYFPVNKDINEAGYVLDGPSFGFTVDTQLSFLRMIYRGIFDELPNLKIILGHNTESLAIYIDRVNTAYRQGLDDPAPGFKKPLHEPSYYLLNNLYGDTSGSFNKDVLYFTKHIFGSDKIILGTDHPYENTKEAVDLILNDEKFTLEEKKAMLSGNAEKLGIGVKHIG